jgi:O-antigen ligase
MTLHRAGTVVVLALAAALLAAVAVGTGRGLAAVLAAVAAAFGVALALQADRYESVMDLVADAGEWALALAPGLMVAYFAFNGGGYFPGSQAFVAVVLALVLALRFWLASEPLAGFGALATVGAGILALFAAWTALSAEWSNAPGRALLETDRVLLYLLALLLFASFARDSDRVRLMVRGLVGGIVLVCTVGLITRVAPDVWPIAPDIQQGRLGYPLTYWNAFGLLAALGLVLSAHLASSEREPPVARVLGAAAMPLLGSALLFTFSRGAIAVAILGLVAYALLARPRGLLGAVLAAAPTTAIAVAASYDANLLAGRNPTSAAAAAQGHDVALVVALCVVGAAVVRTLALWLDTKLSAVHLPSSRARRVVPAVLWAAGAVAVVAVFLAAGGPHQASRNYDRFVKGNAVVNGSDFRSRLGEVGNNRRLDQWRVAMKGYRSDRFKGIGAGTYENLWNQRRPVLFAIRDAHSLYVEVLAELGVSGLLMLASALALIVFALARAMWLARDRYVYAALLAAALIWLVHAGLDWDWEMPAVTIWLFCAGGVALAVSAGDRMRRLRVGPVTRFVLALAALAVAVVPAAITVSEHRLEDAKAAFARGDCKTAEREARRSLDVIGFRAEPHHLIAACAARDGNLPTALSEAREAVRRDPRNWRYQYTLALVLSTSGGDPLPAARAAATLDPLEPQAHQAPRALAGAGARSRARVALDATVP